MGIRNWLARVFTGSRDAPAAALKSTNRRAQQETGMTNMSITTANINNRVGPVMRAGELAEAVVEAAREDNPGREIRVDDKRAYLRIDTDDEMILRRETIERALGRPFKMPDLEVGLSSFAGRIETAPDQIRFYLVKHI
jgi:toluene monooxygenase system protein D